VGVALPGVRWPIIGWWRGEEFYARRPASYWAWQLECLSGCGYSLPVLSVTGCRCELIPVPGPLRRLGVWSPAWSVPDADLPFAAGDPAGVPVLRVLLRHLDVRVRVHAAWALAKVGPPAAAAVEDLRAAAAVNQEKEDPLATFCHAALRQIGAESP
jgi:hypothetical protein